MVVIMLCITNNYLTTAISIVRDHLNVKKVIFIVGILIVYVLVFYLNYSKLLRLNF